MTRPAQAHPHGRRAHALLSWLACGVPCPSATFTVWASAWLAGAAAPDDVLDALAPWADAHDVQAADDAAAAATALPPPGAPVTLADRSCWPRCAGPRPARPARLVLPAPGDVRGLPGPGLFSREATAAGEGVLFADVGLGVVPTPIADGVVRWTVYRVPEPGPGTGVRRADRTPSGTCATRCASRRRC